MTAFRNARSPEADPAPRRAAPGGGETDEALVARVLAADDGAFEAIYDRYSGHLLSFCHHMLGSREEAEDALQQVFMSAYRALRADGAGVALRPWLYAIAHNACVTALRRRHDDAPLYDETAAIEGLNAEVERRADLRALVKDIQRLPADQRAALVLFELGDHSQDEIASVLGVRRKKVKALVFQAREALMSWQAARARPCAEVRQELATLTGGALRRANIRQHVEQCAGCAAREAEIRGQRSGLGVLVASTASSSG